MNSKRVAIIGQGFSGLSLAYALNQKGVNVDVYDQNTNPGGLITTQNTPHGLVETAANAFLNHAELEKMSATIGCPLLPAQKKSQNRYFFIDKPSQWPVSILGTLAFAGKVLFNFITGRLAPRPNQTLYDWGVKTAGAEWADKILSTAVQGIYSVSAQSLSARLVLSRFFKKLWLKNNFDSKFAESIMQQVALYPKLPTQVKGSVSPQDGMGAFMQTLQSYLQNHGVHFYEKKVTLLKALEENYSSVVLATSASDAARILSAEHPEWSQRLSQIQMLSLTSVTQFKEKQHNQLQGFGVLFSRQAKTNALGVLFNDCIFKDRTKDCRSETWILPETESSDETVIEKISLDSQRLTPSVQTAVLATHITRWKEALPQYSPALEELLKTLPIQNNRLHLHGNYLGSLGLSQILIRSKVLAERILAEQATL